MNNANTSIVEIDGLQFAYPRRPAPTLTLDRLTLGRREALLLQGPSGCGKSTLLSLIAGVLSATTGTVRLLGLDWSAVPPRARDQRRADHIGYVFQQFNLLSWMSAIDNVILGCAFSGRRSVRAIAERGSLREAAAHALSAMQLPDSRWSARGAELSVGEQQRVAAARAIIGSPELILADEPTSALDEALRDAFVDRLLAAAHQAGSALLVVSHDRALEQRFPSCKRLNDQSLKAGPSCSG